MLGEVYVVAQDQEGGYVPPSFEGVFDSIEDALTFIDNEPYMSRKYVDNSDLFIFRLKVGQGIKEAVSVDVNDMEFMEEDDDD